MSRDDKKELSVDLPFPATTWPKREGSKKAQSLTDAERAAISLSDRTLPIIRAMGKDGSPAMVEVAADGGIRVQRASLPVTAPNISRGLRILRASSNNTTTAKERIIADRRQLYLYVSSMRRIANDGSSHPKKYVASGRGKGELACHCDYEQWLGGQCRRQTFLYGGAEEKLSTARRGITYIVCFGLERENCSRHD